MAAYRSSHSAWLAFILSLSVILAADGQETTYSSDHLVSAVENLQADAETEKRTAGDPAVEEREWEATRVEDATADKQAFPASDATMFTSTPQFQDDFQEELVIRPLHSGDNYASFQFRTLWQTDFMRGNKGMLTIYVYLSKLYR